MIEALHLGALVPATVGLCCSAAAPRQSRRSAVVGWAPAGVMTAAMADAAFGSNVAPPVLWTMLLVLSSLWPAAHLRWIRSRPGAPTIDHSSVMVIHRSLGSLVMAGLMLVMATPALADRSAVATHHSGAASSIEWMLVTAAIAFVAVSAWLVARVLRAPGRAALVTVEVSAMALSVGVTGVALLV